jgi:hypothetical protein
MDKPALWREISSPRGLEVVCLPWEDDAISRLAINSPEVNIIYFSTLSAGKISNNGIKTLSSLKNLEKIAVACNGGTEGAIISLLDNGSLGFPKLT